MFDIFISFKNDPVGILISKNIAGDLREMGYAVYHNSDENHTGEFDKRLYETIGQCRDFLLIVSEGCLAQLMRHETVDWVREELLCARANNKNIIPVLVEGVTLPKDRNDMPEDLRFLPLLESVSLPLEYKQLPPLQVLTGKLQSKAEAQNEYRNTYNSNPDYNPDADLESLLQRAEAGDTDAMYEVAVFYYHGFTGEKNYPLAYKWFVKVTQSTDERLKALAYAQIANMYFSGVIPEQEQSFVKAYEHRKLAAKYDEWSAQQNAAMSRRGSGVRFDFDEIENNFKALKNRDSISVSEQAKFYLQYGMFNRAIELFLEVRDQMPEASYHLGNLYKLGVHVDPPCPDCFRAAEFFRRAADNGNREAAYALGLLYYNPPLGDFTKDFPLALKYFKLAADAGHAKAQYHVGWFYRYGLGCHKNYAESIRYCQMAADQGHVGGITSLISLYQIPGFINYHKAFLYAKMSAEAGVNSGAYQYATLLFFGRGCEPDMEEALKWYKKAYESGFTDAEIMIEKVQRVLERKETIKGHAE